MLYGAARLAGLTSPWVILNDGVTVADVQKKSSIGIRVNR